MRLSSVSRRWHTVCYGWITAVKISLDGIPTPLLPLLGRLAATGGWKPDRKKKVPYSPTVDPIIQRLHSFTVPSHYVTENFLLRLHTLTNLQALKIEICLLKTTSDHPNPIHSFFPSTLTKLRFLYSGSSTLIIPMVGLNLPKLHKLRIDGPLCLQSFTLPALRDFGYNAPGELPCDLDFLSGLHLHHLHVNSGYTFLFDTNLCYLTDLRSLTCFGIAAHEHHTFPFLERASVTSSIDSSGWGEEGSISSPRLTSLRAETCHVFKSFIPSQLQQLRISPCKDFLLPSDIQPFVNLQSLRLEGGGVMISLPSMAHLTSLSLDRVDVKEIIQPNLLSLYFLRNRRRARDGPVPNCLLLRIEAAKLSHLCLINACIDPTIDAHLPSLQSLVAVNSHFPPSFLSHLTRLAIEDPSMALPPLSGVPLQALDLDLENLLDEIFQQSFVSLNPMPPINSLRVRVSYPRNYENLKSWGIMGSIRRLDSVFTCLRDLRTISFDFVGNEISPYQYERWELLTLTEQYGFVWDDSAFPKLTDEIDFDYWLIK